MKLSKFSKTALVFTLGATVFTTTAFADMMLGSGYDKFKNAIKGTAKQLEQDFSSYTESSNVTIMFDNEPLMTMNNIMKVDNVNKQDYEWTDSQDFVKLDSSYSSENYSSPSIMLYKSGDDEYYGHRYDTPLQDYIPGNGYNEAFKNEYAPEFEKVVDAAVGSLKNIIQYESLGDDKNKYSGELNASQIPALYNAMLSLVFKDSMSYDYNQYRELSSFPKEINDIYISNVYGEATEHEDGYLSSIAGQLELTFNDENKQSHTFTVSLEAELIDVNNTVVEKPIIDESTLEVIKEEHHSALLPSKYIGTYKSDIVVETNNEFVKIGERIVTFTEITDTMINGSFEEIYTDHELAEGIQSFKATFEDIVDGDYISFVNPNDGITYYANVWEHGNGSIYFEPNYVKDEDGDFIHAENIQYINDGVLKRVFE